MINNIYTDLINIFIALTNGEPNAQLGPPFVFYYADSQAKNDILINSDGNTVIYNLDIKSAYPTICKILFGIESEFVQKIYSISDKKQRNILISTTLKKINDEQHIDYIAELTLLSKILIFCYAYTFYNNITILEYVKDGMYILGTKNMEFSDTQLKFINIMKEYNIEYHDDMIKSYIRFNKTTILKTENDTIKEKGIYHGLPQCIHDILSKFYNGLIYNDELLNLIQEYYSNTIFNIVYHGHLKTYFEYLYKFKDDHYLDINGKPTTNISEINARSYLYNIIYPLLNLFRIYNHQ